MPAPLTWTKFSFDDFFDDPAVRSMTNEEVGAYMRLLHAAHRSRKPGVLPDDDQYLSSVCLWTMDQWLGHRVAMAKAWVVRDCEWTQKRMVKEYAAAIAAKSADSRNGSKGAEVRWRGHSQAIADLDLDKEKRRVLDSKSEPAYRQKSRINGLVKDLASHLKS